VPRDRRAIVAGETWAGAGVASGESMSALGIQRLTSADLKGGGSGDVTKSMGRSTGGGGLIEGRRTPRRRRAK